MKRLPIWILVISLIWPLMLAAKEGPVIGPPTRQELHAVHLPATAKVTVFIYNNQGKYAFAIYNCENDEKICYYFRSKRIDDFVCLASKDINEKLERLSRNEVLKFFITRFQGIANDIVHQRWRPDVTVKYLGPLVPMGGDDAKSYILFSLFYDGYVSSMEKVLNRADHLCP